MQELGIKRLYAVNMFIEQAMKQLYQMAELQRTNYNEISMQTDPIKNGLPM